MIQFQLEKNLELHSKQESSVQSLEEWITSMEEQIKASPDEADSIQESLQIQQNEFTRLSNLFNEITSTGSQRVSALLSAKEEIPDESIKTRKKRLKMRFDALTKAITQDRERCSKTVNSWKELDSSVKFCRAVLKDAENKIDKIENGSFEQRVDTMKDVVQTASRRIAQSHRLLEVS